MNAKHLLSGITMAVFLTAAIASGDKDKEKEISSTEKAQPEAKAIEIAATQLAKEYEDNEVAADQKYKEKVLIVSGKVKDIGKDVAGDIYVVLAGGDEMAITDVQCTFSTEHTNEAAQLKKGQALKIKAECGGKMMNVQLSGSSIVN